MHLVMIGGSDAGISAALRARELDPGVEVTVVTRSATSTCPTRPARQPLGSGPDGRPSLGAPGGAALTLRHSQRNDECKASLGGPVETTKDPASMVDR
jgi:hypothetical protein